MAGHPVGMLRKSGRQQLAFQDRYNATTTPFKWKFTAADLADVIARIDRHEPTPPPPIPKKSRTARKKTATTPQAA
jgi:hypothetical protein